jgi:hypothetical protein
MTSETIRMGGLELRFLQTKDETAGSLDAFEMTVQPNARMPVAHYHESWDETIYGLTGASTWRVDGQGRAQAWADRLHQTRDRSQLSQRQAGSGGRSVHSDARRARARLFSRDCGRAGRRRAGSDKDERNHAAPRARARTVIKDLHPPKMLGDGIDVLVAAARQVQHHQMVLGTLGRELKNLG